MKIIIRASKTIKTLFSKKAGLGSIVTDDGAVDRRFGM